MDKEFYRKPTKKKSMTRTLVLGGLLICMAALFAIWMSGRGPERSAKEPGAGGEAAVDSTEAPFDLVEDGIHVRTGFVAADGMMPVVRHCTPCHSAKLVTQNRMTREGWEATIRWMQKTQNLWDLGAEEAVILDYLAAHYAPEAKGRRQNLQAVEWYELETEAH